MKKLLTVFLCTLFLALPVLAENAAKSAPAKASTPANTPAPSEPDSATEIKLLQQKLDFFKERLDTQDKRISDLALFLGVAIAFFGALITGVMVFLSFRSTKEAVLEAKDESRRQAKEAVGNWVDKEGKQRLEELLKPEIEIATKKIQDAASSILVELARETKNTQELNQQHKQFLADIQLQELTQEQKKAVDSAVEKLESKAPVNYGFDDWLTQGIKAYQEGKFENAAEYFGKAEKAAVKPADRVIALTNKGVTLGQMGKNDEEIAVYDDVVRRYGDAPEAGVREQVAKALYNKGVRLGQMGKNDEAIAIYDEVTRRYGDSPEAEVREQVARALNNKGVTLGQMGKNAEAIAVYDEVARCYGDSPGAGMHEQVARALNNKGATLCQMGNNDEAIAVYAEVVRRYGDAPETGVREQVAGALYNKGVRLGQVGKNEEAIAVFDEVAGHYGDAPEAGVREQVAKALNSKGVRLGQMGKNDEAIAIFDEVARRYGDASEAGLHEQVAIALSGKGVGSLCAAKEIWRAGDENSARARLALALSAIDAALVRKPDAPISLGNRGYILFLQGDTEGARAVLAQAIQLGGEELRQGELKDADIHPLPQDEAFKALVNSL